MNSFENQSSSKEKEKELRETDVYPIVNNLLQQRYDRIAIHWESTAYEGTRRDDLIPRLIELGDMRGGERVLEAMCGTAVFLRELHAKYPECEYYALDFSRGMLNAAPETLRKVQASVIAMPFADASFDRVFLRSAIYDLPKRLQLKALAEINRILKKSGSFVLQTFYTTDKTFKTLNDLVNIKDLASGQYLDMGQEYPRYFSTREELESWFEEAGLSFEAFDEYSGIIRYMRAKEMTTLGQTLWLDYVKSLSAEMRKAINLQEEPDGTLSYSFPGVIYRLRNK
ncbi:MAG: methyltransferase domain-containing protein [Patescibacteria group bacterium]